MAEKGVVLKFFSYDLYPTSKKSLDVMKI